MAARNRENWLEEEVLALENKLNERNVSSESERKYTH